MVFLFRAAFWLFVVFMMLPAGLVGHPSPPQATATLRTGAPIETASLAAGAGSFCITHARTCRDGIAAASAVQDGVASGLSLLTPSAPGTRPARHKP